jgi:hypothetical protein
MQYRSEAGGRSKISCGPDSSIAAELEPVSPVLDALCFNSVLRTQSDVPLVSRK